LHGLVVLGPSGVVVVAVPTQWLFHVHLGVLVPLFSGRTPALLGLGRRDGRGRDFSEPLRQPLGSRFFDGAKNPCAKG
jgi:hypothetical protein